MSISFEEIIITLFILLAMHIAVLILCIKVWREMRVTEIQVGRFVNGKFVKRGSLKYRMLQLLERMNLRKVN